MFLAKHVIEGSEASELGNDMAGQESEFQPAELLEVKTARLWSEVLVAILETARMRIIVPSWRQEVKRHPLECNQEEVTLSLLGPDLMSVFRKS